MAFTTTVWRAFLGAALCCGFTVSVEAGALLSTGAGLSEGDIDTNFTVAWDDVDANDDQLATIVDQTQFPNTVYADPNSPANWVVFDRSGDSVIDTTNATPDTLTHFWVRTVFDGVTGTPFSGRLAADNQVDMYLDGSVDSSGNWSGGGGGDFVVTNPGSQGFLSPTNWSFNAAAGSHTLWFYVTNLNQSGGNPAALLFEYNDPSAIVTAPEPGTLALIGSGIFGMFGYGWRKRKQAVA